MTTASDTASSVWTFILEFWWLIWIVIIVGGSLLEGVRDFFIDAYLTVARARHQHRMEEIKARQKAAKKAAALPGYGIAAAPGPCKHLHLTRVYDRDDNFVSWLCLNEDCSAQLPPNTAARAEDLE
jgi:hypothetical protein